ncbi:MAG: hypothetical protein ACK4NY_10695 [Spirosomataceae bacterium]
MNSSFDIKKFSKKLIFFGLPIILVVFGYFIFDPFQILYTYDSYPDDYAKSLNRDRISTQMYLNGKEKYNYNSFIFGSSRSSVFYAKDWAKFINEPYPYHFDASCETISGIANKLKFIDKNGSKIKNALIVIDIGTFEYEQDTLGAIFVQDYRASGLPWYKYHLIFFNSYFSNAFFLRYFDYKLFGKFRPYMNGFLEHRFISYTPINNDFIFTSYEDDLKKMGEEKYYQQPFFYERDSSAKISKPIIQAYQLKFLGEIKSVLDKHQTDYKIVIGPMYNQLKFNPKDIEILENQFGKRNIYDYSGVNEFTKDKRNYYEIYHYRPQVARQIMSRIYTKKP